MAYWTSRRTCVVSSEAIIRAVRSFSRIASARGGHASPQALEHGGDGALRDGQAEHLGGKPRQPLEADMMAVVQVGQQRTDAGTERRARGHPRRRRGPVAPAAPTAATAQQFHPRHHRPDRRQIDMVVAVPAALRCARHVRPAVTAGSGDDALGPLDRLGTGLSGVSVSGRALPSRDGRGLLDALSDLALPRPNPSFEGSTCELLDVLRGRPTSPSSSCIRNACCSIRSCCCASSASFSTSLNLKRGRSGMLQVNQIAAPAATPLSHHREQLRMHGAMAIN